MNITLHLSTEEQIELAKRAAASGRDVAGYVQDVVQQQLETDETGAVREPLSRDEWNREFRNWIASHRSRTPHLDDSRESIYD